MRQDQLDGLVVFLCVADALSFSAAAVRLGVSPSAVSQAIRALETRVGVPLFNRTTRSVSLTEHGARYRERIEPAIRDLLSAAEEIGDAAQQPAGLLRLNVPRSAYMLVLQPRLRAFLAAHPAIRLEVMIDAHLIDIVGGGFDAGIRFGDLVDRDMIGICVGPPLAAHIVAAPAYLARHGVPRMPRDLLEHDCIGYRHATSGQIERWAFARDGAAFEMAVDGRLIVNDSEALLGAALDGLGIAYTINGRVDAGIGDGRLVRLLAEWSPPLAGLTLYYPNRRRVPAKLRALIDFLRNDRPGAGAGAAVSRPDINRPAPFR